jgi:tetratricopeptide (TPR) repeat protein
MVLLLVLLVGGWLLLDARARQSREAQARDALAKARSLLEQARAGNDPAPWAEARALTRRAEALLEQGPSELAEEVRALLRLLDQEQEDRKMLAGLSEAIVTGLPVTREPDRGLVVRTYEEAFARYGIPVQDLPLEEAAERLRGRAIRAELAAALDRWARLKSKASDRKHLQDLAMAVDEDERRKEIRRALAQQDLKVLKRLSTPDQGATLPPETVLLLADALTAEKALGEVEALLRRAQKEHPGDFWVNQRLGVFFLFQCNPARIEEASRCCTAAVAVRNDNQFARECLGLVLKDLGKLDEAQDTLERAIRLRPDFPDPHAILGTVLAKKGKIDEAIAAYEEAIRLNKNYAYPHYHMGVALYDKGQVDKAIVCFENALHVKPDYAAAHYLIGNIRKDQGRHKEASAAYRIALRCNPRLAEAKNNLGLALQQSGREREAMQAFRETISLNPALPEGHFNLGKVLMKEGRLDDAIEAFRRAAALKPEAPEIHRNRGIALSQNGRQHEAVNCFREAVRLENDNAEAHSNLAFALYLYGDMDGTISSSREAIRLQRTLAKPHNTQGLALVEKGRIDEAIASHREAIRLDKSSPDAHLNLGSALFRKGLLDEAIASYREAIRLKGDYALAHCYLGMAFRDQGRFAEAIASLQRGHKLSARVAGWSHRSAEWLRHCERLAMLDRKLPAIRAGADKPANAAEQIELAWICTVKQCYAAAAGFYADAFAAGGEEAEKHKAQYRYSAACCAAEAGCGRGKDAGPLKEEDRRRWRKQALQWLRAELVGHSRRLKSSNRADRQEVQHQMQRWLADSHFDDVRSVKALAWLAAEERKEWRKLWAEVEALRQKGQEQPK